MSEQPISPTVQLNTRGLRCPEPVMMLHQAIRKKNQEMLLKCWRLTLRLLGISLSFVCIWDMNSY